MIRRLSYALLLLLLLLLPVFASCEGRLEADGAPYIELSLFCEDAVLTRAGKDGTKEGEDPYNENYMDVVDVFFYPGDTLDRTMDATYHIRLESKKRTSDVFHIELTSDIINERIFPLTPEEKRKATVFAVVNYHGTLVSDEDALTGTSVAALEQIVVASDFAGPSDHKQTDFLMSGSTMISLRGRTQTMTASGAIDLARYACKMTTSVKVASRVMLSNGEIWTPMLEGMEIYLVDGVNTVALSGEDPDPQFFSYSNNRKRFASVDGEGHYNAIVGLKDGFYQTYPMYMYPQHWVYGSNEGSEREPYLKLVVPWNRLEENGFTTTQKQLYYKIVIPEDTREAYRHRFVRNNWYDLNIDVGILGAETDEAAITIDPCICYVAYWQGSGIDKYASIGSARYLSVERDSIALNNLNSVEVTYTTSHPVIIKEGTIKVTRPYYGTVAAGRETMGAVVRNGGPGTPYASGTKYLEYDETHRRNLNGGEDWFSNSGTFILYEHELQNDFRSLMFDYSPYRITFTLVHADRPNDTRYSKDIILIQRPAIYIEAVHNSDESFVYVGHDVLGNKDNYNKKIHTSDHWGYVYVDNEQIVRPDIRNTVIDETYMEGWRAQGFDYPDAEEYHWRIVWYTGGTLDLFKMNVTVLPPNSDFVIGDPRSLTINNLRNSDDNPDNDFHDAPAIYDGPTRSLKYYYPAEGSDRTINMMAPSYRLTSKCNGIEFGDLTFEQAQMRCAVYQEDGFPAGRWRLPTRGEIHFIAMLSANGAFEPLFTNNSSYWSANGGIKVQTGNVTFVNVEKALTRCVYDSWYWGDEQWPDREQFIWGDKPR